VEFDGIYNEICSGLRAAAVAVENGFELVVLGEG
jgi:hypothetical protein